MAPPRFVELIRVSSAGQAERDTPEDQRRALDRLRAARPGVIIERIEQQVSGAADMAERPDLARLTELAAARAFDEVRVRHLDRLTRHEDPAERFAVFSIVRQAGAVIVDASGAVLEPSTMGGEVMFYVSTLAAAEERRKILARTRAAKDRLAREGRLVSSWAPYGRTFDKKTGQWGTDERLEMGRRIFRDFLAAGASLRSVCARLNAEGVPTASGRGEWSSGHLRRFLAAQTALGRYTTHGHTFSIPPLVDEETFQAAAVKLKANRWQGSGPTPKHEALLRKLLVCGVCGCTMYVDKGGSGKHQHLYYLCSGGDSECRVYHRADKVDAEVRRRVEAWVRHPEHLLAAVRSRTAEATADPEKEIRTAEAELRDLDKREEKLARLVTKGVVSERTGVSQLREIGAARKDAERRLKDSRGRAATRALATDEEKAIEERLAALRADLDHASVAEWREVVALLFPRSLGGIQIDPSGEMRGTGVLDLSAPLPTRKPSHLSGRARQIPASTIPLSFSGFVPRRSAG